ncbi:MAG: T9SS type A sorting domain-containing protein [Bacteroidota bacterium]
MYRFTSSSLLLGLAVLLALSASAQPQPSWQPLSTGAQSLPQPVSSAMDAAGNVYVLQFQPNGFRPEMARWDGSQWTTLPGLPPQYANRIAVTDGGDALYVATQVGTDRAVNGNGGSVGVAYVARYGIATGQWDDLGGGLDQATVQTIDVDAAGNLLVGGRFAQTTDGTTLGNIGRWNQSTGIWEGLGLGVSDPVVDLDADPFGNVVVTGRFETATQGDGTALTVRQVARFRFATGRWEALFNGLDVGSSTPRTIATDGTNVFIGGTGIEINTDVRQVWRFNGTVWSGFGSSLDLEPNIYDLVLDGAGFLYAFGDGGFGVRSTIHQSNAGFANWSAIAVIANGFPSTLAANRGRPGRYLFAGGLFDNFFLFNGSLTTVANFALWNGAWTSPQPPFVGVSGTVRAVEELIVPRNGDPLDRIRLMAVGGDLASVRNRPVNRIAFSTTGADWDDPGQGITDPGGIVHALRATALPLFADGGGLAMMVAGRFTEVTQDDGTAVPVSNVALWRFGDERWQALGLGVSRGGVPGTGTVHAIDHLPLPCRFDEDAGEFIYVGGEFDTATNADGSTVAVRNLARYNLRSNRWEALAGGPTGPVFALRLEAGQRSRLVPTDDGLEGHALFIGGQFNTVLDANGMGVAGARNLAWLTTDGQWRAIGGGPAGPVYALESLRSSATRLATLNQRLAGPDRCRLDVTSTTLYVGGSFTSVLTDGPNLPVSNLARVLVGTGGSRWSELGLPFGQASGTPGNGTNGPVLSIEFRPEVSSSPSISFFGEDNGAFAYMVTGTFTEAYDEFGNTITSPNVVLLRNYAPLYPGGQFDDDPVRRGPEVFASIGDGTNGTVFDTGWTSCRIGRFDTSTWYVGGQFSEVGAGQQAPGLAKWRDYRPPPPVVVVGSSGSIRGGSGGSGGGRATDVVYLGPTARLSCANPGLGRAASSSSSEVLGTVAFGESVVTTTDFPVGQPLVFELAAEDGTVLSTDTLVVDNIGGVTFAVTGVDTPGDYAPNPDGFDTGLGLVALQSPDRALPLGDRLLTRFVHAVTDAPAVDVVLPDGTVFADSLTFNAVSVALAIDRSTPRVEVRRHADGAALGTYDLDFSNPSAVQFVVLAGFLDPAANQDGPALGLTTVALPAEAPVASDDDTATRPAAVRLSAAYPNPFAETTVLRVDVPEATRTEVAVFDLLGRRVAVLHDGLLTPGTHAVPWNAGSVPSGVYVVQVRTPSGTDALRLTRLR